LTHDIALIPSDGIGKEVVAEARRVLEQAGEIWDFDFEWTEYKYRREVREYGETVVVSIQSLIDNHPELQDMLSDQGVDEGQMEFVAMIPPDEGPQFVVADAAGRIKVLADELVKVQKREEEIKQEMKELLR
jgi:Isocitrate/isopropylmalate dehydrogenase